MLSWVSPWMLRSARCTTKRTIRNDGSYRFPLYYFASVGKTIKLWVFNNELKDVSVLHRFRSPVGWLLSAQATPCRIKCSHVIHYLESTRQGTSKRSSSFGVNETGRQCRWLGLSEPTNQQDTELIHHCLKKRCFFNMHNSLDCKLIISIKCDCNIPINW